jgi:hypothetical protein
MYSGGFILDVFCWLYTLCIVVALYWMCSGGYKLDVFWGLYTGCILGAIAADTKKFIMVGLYHQLCDLLSTGYIICI